MLVQIMTFPIKVLGYFAKIFLSIIKLLLIKFLYSIDHSDNHKAKFRSDIPTKIVALVEYPRLTIPSHVKGGDSSVHDDLMRVLTRAGYQVKKIPYDPNFPVKSKFAKFMIGMPYVYSQIIKNIASNYDLFICDSRVVWDLGNLPCISLFHDSYLGYLKLVGAGLNPLGYLNSLVFSEIQIVGNRNTTNIAVSDFLKDILEQSGIKVARVINNGIDIEVFKPTKKVKFVPDKLLYLGGYAYLGKGIDLIRHLGKIGFHIDCITNRQIANWPNIYFSPQLKRAETIDAYQQHALTLYPSRFESCQMVPLESMACGTPVVISGVGIGQDLSRAIPEFVVNSYSDGVVTEYRKKINKILANREHYSRLAREYVVKYHNLKDFGSAWIKTIEDFYANTL